MTLKTLPAPPTPRPFLRWAEAGRHSGRLPQGRGVVLLRQQAAKAGALHSRAPALQSRRRRPPLPRHLRPLHGKQRAVLPRPGALRAAARAAALFQVKAGGGGRRRAAAGFRGGGGVRGGGGARGAVLRVMGWRTLLGEGCCAAAAPAASAAGCECAVKVCKTEERGKTGSVSRAAAGRRQGFERRRMNLPPRGPVHCAPQSLHRHPACCAPLRGSLIRP